MVLLEELVKFGHHEPGRGVELKLQLESRDVADRGGDHVDLVDEELGDVGSGLVVSNSDSTREQDVDNLEFDGQLSGAVESGPELKVCSALDRDVLIGSR